MRRYLGSIAIIRGSVLPFTDIEWLVCEGFFSGVGNRGAGGASGPPKDPIGGGLAPPNNQVPCYGI